MSVILAKSVERQLEGFNKHETLEVVVGKVKIGGGNPVVVQSMALGGADDVKKDAREIVELARAGSELVRVAINSDEAIKNIPYFRDELVKNGFDGQMIVGCGQYELERLLYQYPECASALAKIRVNPGNVGFGDKRDAKFERVIEYAIKSRIPVRIGVNWGSLDKYLLARLMDENGLAKTPKPANFVLRKALVLSALTSAKRAEEIGLPADMIVVSCKTSAVIDLINVYTELAAASNYALHLGLTEAGMGIKGVVNVTAGLAPLLLQGIGDTVRASLTQKPGESRTQEVKVCQEVLQSLGLRHFAPQIASCPGCNRTKGQYFQQLTYDVNNYVQSRMYAWKAQYRGVERMKIAVMGCIVNGPGESKHADLGISLPGSGEKPVAVVYSDGKKITILQGGDIFSEFCEIIENYVRNHYQNG